MELIRYIKYQPLKYCLNILTKDLSKINKIFYQNNFILHFEIPFISSRKIKRDRKYNLDTFRSVSLNSSLINESKSLNIWIVEFDYYNKSINNLVIKSYSE